MILFFISLFLVFSSSYLLTSVFAKKNKPEGLIYLPIFMFSQIVLGFEILSLGQAIDQINFLTYNFLFLLTSILIFHKKQSCFWNFNVKPFFNKIKNALILDKSLIILCLAYLFFIFVTIFLTIISPITNTDASDYHIARSAFWIGNQSLSHFEAIDIRQLAFPINSEILYAWVILFTRKLVFFGMFSFVGYLLAIISLFNIMSDYCYRKRLWVIFILSSFASVIVQASGTETDIIIAGLICASIYLFKISIKTIDKRNLFIASLAYALAIGTKTTAIIAIPAVCILFIFYLIKNSRPFSIKPFLYFIGYGIINFLIFSSFNYVLNYIHFGNIIGPENFIISHKNMYGLKGAFANFIKHTTLLFDFTGFKFGQHATNYIIPLKNNLLTFLELDKIPDGVFSRNLPVLNSTLIEPIMGYGIIGIITFIPSIVIALLIPIVKPSKKTLNLLIYSLVFLVGLFTLSYSISYMVYNVRFITFFIILSAPILVYTYNKNLLKYLIELLCIFYLVLVSTHLWARPYFKIADCLFKYHESISLVRQRILASNYDKNIDKRYLYTSNDIITNVIKKYGKTKKILILFSSPHNYIDYQMLNLKGYNLSFKNLENMTPEIFKSYDLVLTTANGQSATNIINFEKNKKLYTLNKDKTQYDFLGGTPDFPCVYYDINSTLTNETGAYRTYCEISNDFLQKNNYRTDYKIYANNPKDPSKPLLKYVFLKKSD